jgi:hypothetical protein
MNTVLSINIVIVLWLSLELWTMNQYNQSTIGCVYSNKGRLSAFGVMGGLFLITQVLYLYNDVSRESSSAVNVRNLQF